jgi:gliding motility-associated-like protein
LYLSPPNYNYFWYDMPGMIPLYNGNPYVTPILYSSHTYWVYADNGYCTSVLTPVHVDVMHCQTQIPPNIITPNGDGYNDFLKIDAYGAQSIQCSIFNRWGIQIYSWNDTDGGWDGKNFQGIPVDEGVYFYVVEVVEIGGNVSTKTGFVHVLR